MTSLIEHVVTDKGVLFLFATSPHLPDKNPGLAIVVRQAVTPDYNHTTKTAYVGPIPSISAGQFYEQILARLTLTFPRSTERERRQRRRHRRRRRRRRPNWFITSRISPTVILSGARAHLARSASADK